MRFLRSPLFVAIAVYLLLSFMPQLGLRSIIGGGKSAG